MENKNKMALATIDFIDKRIKYLDGDLSQGGQNLEQYKQNNRVTDVQADAQLNLQKAEDYKQQMASVQTQLNIVESLTSYMYKPSNKFTMVPSTIGIQDPALTGLITKYNDAQQEYQRLMNNVGEKNPLVENSRNQLESLKESIAENLRSIKKELIISRNNLSSNAAEFESKIRTAPVVERGLKDRSREQTVKENLFQYLAQKREEASLSLLTNVPGARVVDSPNYGTGPDKPKKALILMCSFILGCVLPASYVYAKGTINNKIQTVEELHQLPNARIIGELCHNNVKQTLVINPKSRTTISELFRYIRTNLSYDNTMTNQVMLVTSSIQGEGKTFLSINLGATLAMANKKVVILEFDLRKPDLIKGMNLNYPLGITDYLNSDEIAIESIIKPSKVSQNLWVISAGCESTNPAEEMLNPKIGNLFEYLRETFDYVIVDTAPIGLVADAFSLVPYTDSSIYVVRYNYTEKEQLNILQDIFSKGKLKNPMVILNDAKKENMKAYGYGAKPYAV